jgi:hypothetical protein
MGLWESGICPSPHLPEALLKIGTQLRLDPRRPIERVTWSLGT